MIKELKVFIFVYFSNLFNKNDIDKIEDVH